ncbi:SDR family NAD(P)-dependent oxidoreductase [Sinomicrobium pectinilyticum]|uniref:SDR family NAD(P)-dependent oxidoreductase n=1 Tax=Sinomicrobium pectinilyticum TaxID=1084421 RepID=A0A3N0EQ46_SINP1|nr:SDR family NAD(P)-dependent oxidoreductase [Sinomicrobium pectinilyticum]RNL89867.1 SDR family NAD(P)-dependent oxidoreductase [Sinomicrobium pectinilyticum]
MNFKTKKILITGGSSGIGKAIVKDLYEKGATSFAVVGRSAEKMKSLKTDFPRADFLFLPGDVAKTGDLKQISAAVDKHWGKLDILINNAGVVSAGPLEETSDEDIISQLNINVAGLILLTKYTLPLLRESEEAAIINVSSGLGLIGMPFYATYAATKAAVSRFSEAMRRELNGTSIHVMTVYPTATDTPMMETAATGNMDSPELVAQLTLEGLTDKKIRVVLGGDQRLEDEKTNFEKPLEFDKKVSTLYDAMQKRAANHRSM